MARKMCVSVCVCVCKRMFSSNVQLATIATSLIYLAGSWRRHSRSSCNSQVKSTMPATDVGKVLNVPLSGL